MKKEYDFSKGVRAKFYHHNAKLELPIYLEPENAKFLHKMAAKNGMDIKTIVNNLIRKDIELIETVTG